MESKLEMTPHNNGSELISPSQIYHEKDSDLLLLSTKIAYQSFQFLLKTPGLETGDYHEIIKENFLCSEKSPELQPLISRVHAVVVKQLSSLLSSTIVDVITEKGCLCILNQDFATISQFAQRDASLSSSSPKIELLEETSPLENERKTEKEKEETISRIVKKFNKHFRQRKPYKEKAFALISEIEKRSWIFSPEGTKLSLNPEEVFIARKSLLGLYSCEDPEIMEKALKLYIEIVECDPLKMESAYGLVELQEILLLKIQTKKTQNLNTQLQRLLIKAYAITLECILIHASSNHLNALTKEIKEQIWTSASEIADSNIVEDPEINFWVKYAVQGAQNIKTAEDKVAEWLIRIAKVSRGVVGLALCIYQSSDVLPAMDRLFEDMREAFHHIENKEDWFPKLLMLKKFCRYWMNNEKKFSKVVELIKKQTCKKTKKVYRYGLVSTLEYTASMSSSTEVKEDSLKLLIQYYLITNGSISERSKIALENLSTCQEPKLRNTVKMLLSLLDATKHNPRDIDPFEEDSPGSPRFSLENPTDQELVVLPPQPSEQQEITDQKEIASAVKASRRISRKSFLYKSSSYSKAANSITKENVYKNVIEFLIRRLAGIKEKKNHTYGGDSLVTLLSYSTEDALVPAILRCLSQFSSEFYEPNIKGETPFHISVKANNVKMVQHIARVLQHIDINAQEYEDFNTALHNAVNQKHYAMVSLLLKLGANPDMKNRLGLTPLHISVKANTQSITELLLKRGASSDIMDEKGTTPLTMAIHLDHPTQVDILLRYTKNRKKITPIITAARDKSETTLIYLLHTNKKELSPLESYEIVRMISHDGERLCSDSFAQFHMNLMETDENYSKSFRYYTEWPTLRRGENGEIQLVATIKRKNTIPYDHADFQDRSTRVDAFGNTLTIKYARQQKWLSSLKEILSGYPETLNQPNFFGITPLHAAIMARNHPAVHLLLDRKADTSLGDVRGFTALHFAAYVKDHRIIKSLLEKGANPNTPNEHGDTPFLLFCGFDFSRYPESLIPIIGKSKKRAQTLRKHNLQTNMNCKTLDLMIQHEADPLYRDKWENNALHHAAQWGSPSVIEYLCQRYPALFWQKNAFSVLPVYAAINEGRGDFLEYFLQGKISQDSQRLNKRFIIVTEGVHTSGDVLVCAGQMGMLGKLFDTIPEAPYQREATPLAYTPLHTAALLGKEEVIDIYCNEERKLNLNSTDAFGNTAAHIAALKKKAAFMKKLVSCGADLSIKNQDGGTPMHFAATKTGDAAIETFKAIFEKYPELALERDGCRDTPLHLACQYGNFAIVKLICETHPGLTKAINDDVNTPLHLACANGHEKIAAYLAKFRVDLEARNAFGLTPLLLAAQQGHKSATRVLLTLNAEIRAQDDEDETVLHKAVFNRHFDIIEMILEKEKSRIRLDKATLVDLTDLNGNSPLHKIGQRKDETSFANDRIDEAILQLFMDAKADLHRSNKQGETFLHLVCYRGLNHLIDYLKNDPKKPGKSKRTHVDFSVVNKQKNSILHKACEGGNLSTVKKLIGIVNIDIENEEGITPFLLSVTLGYTEIATFLWDAGANAAHTDRKGRNILHLILENHSLSVEMLHFFEQIVKANPDLIKKRDKHKRTPLHVIAENNHMKALDILLTHLPGPSQDYEKYFYKKTKAKQTAYAIARERDFFDLAKKISNFPRDKVGQENLTWTKKKQKNRKKTTSKRVSQPKVG